MKFSVKINGVSAGAVEAENACDAVDAAREHHADKDSKIISLTPPLQGGEYAMSVESDVPWIDSAGKTQPPGVVSSFAYVIEPDESVRELVEQAAREAEAAAEAEALRAEIREEERAKLIAEMAAGKDISK